MCLIGASEIIVSSPNVTADLDSPLTLTCIVEADRDDDVVWYYGGEVFRGADYRGDQTFTMTADQGLWQPGMNLIRSASVDKQVNREIEVETRGNSSIDRFDFNG